MKLNIRGKNIEVTPALREYVEKRLAKLDKYLDNDQEVKALVTLVVEKDTHRVEVTIPARDIIFRGEEETGDMYASIDLVLEKLERQLAKYKDRNNKKGRESLLRAVLNLEPEQPEPRIVKTKKFAFKPMSVEEAVLQMVLLGHNFFVFSNAETNEVNVVYRRKDGNFGLIEPEF